MNEASFFGYEQEDLAEERQKLEEAAKEIDAGTAKTIPWETVKAEMERERGYTFDEESEDEKALFLPPLAISASMKPGLALMKAVM